MINRLLEHYPTAYTSKTPIQTKGTICFWLEDGQQYIGIPIEDLTPEETELLKSLFPTFHEETTLNDTYQEKRWYDFLLNNEKRSKKCQLPLKMVYSVLFSSPFQKRESILRT